jgi:hypothetical protein
MAEADVAISGIELDFAQSMTLRVAVGSFLMSCKAIDLGEIGPLYAERCQEILKVIHGDIKLQGAPRLEDADIGTEREVERLEAALRWIGANCEDADTVRDNVSRALRGKSVP